jgi:hypothetical protein
VLGGKVKAKLPDAEKRQSRDDLAKLFRSIAVLCG